MYFKITTTCVNFQKAYTVNDFYNINAVYEIEIVNERRLWEWTENTLNEQNVQFLDKKQTATIKVFFRF